MTAPPPESKTGVMPAIVTATLALLLGCGAALALRTRPALAGLDEPAKQSAAASRLAAEPFRPRTAYGRRLEPADNTILHGAGQTDRRSFDSYTAAVQPDGPTLFMTYVDLRDDLPEFFQRLGADLQHFAEPPAATRPISQIIPQIIPQIGLSLNRGNPSRHYEEETARGDDDRAIAALCTGLHALGRPVFLRIGYEFNAPWNGYRPASYRAAFRRIATAVHTCSGTGAALVWDWSPDAELDAQSAGAAVDADSAGTVPATLPARLQDFYPGDDAVDWWALNIFSTAGMLSPATQRFLHAADRSRHPVMIAEATPRGFSVADANARTAWFAPYFGLVRSSPGIRAFCYIDWNWAAYPQWADWGDARLETDSPTLAWYRRQLHTLPLSHGPQQSQIPRHPHAASEP